MNAQVSFLDTTLSLVHIPLPLYSALLQPILKVLLPDSQHQNQPPNPSSATHSKHPFINISVTPLECSIVCPTAWAHTLFDQQQQQPRQQPGPSGTSQAGISISQDTYLALCVTSASTSAGSRVADLTSPLARAAIPIFFITTYYADFILVPTRDRPAVEQTLLAGGFAFAEGGGADETALLVSSGRGPAGTGIGAGSAAEGELLLLEEGRRTFELLRKSRVVPYVEAGLRLVQCSGRERSAFLVREGWRSTRGRGGGGSGGGRGTAAAGGSTAGGGSAETACWVDTVDAKLYTSVVSALVSQPRFLSITLAQEDPPSLLMDRELLGMFGDSVVGPTEGALVPIFLDLADLPFEATGIVSGVAGRLVKEMRMEEDSELSYLSTARAGAVILSWEDSVRALAVLRPLLTEDG
ncbi:GATS-like protein 1 [Madurella mycetomatis]|uniref:GATS-like protein 1 n=1 Tax=Madurella mycetomatis TaxID=100816 RepID=A0A175W424_9PEZI|nr:GATS-like protein 1 [Madurella mycetomatis]